MTNNDRTGTTVTPIGPDELPPPYNTLTGGVPMVSCRVCGNMIDISGKKDQVREKSHSFPEAETQFNELSKSSFNIHSVPKKMSYFAWPKP